MILTILVNGYDFSIFFNDCWQFFEKKIEKIHKNFTLKEIYYLTTNIVFLNYNCNTNYNINIENEFYANLKEILEIEYNIHENSYLNQKEN